MTQIPSVVLPSAVALANQPEIIDDLLTHVSREFEVDSLLNKQAYIVAVEDFTAGVPGPLWVWVELSPVPSTNNPLYWAAIGGGGGTLPPLNPMIIAANGVLFDIHGALLPWTQHSVWARIVVQTPVSVNIATAVWDVQVLFSGA